MRLRSSVPFGCLKLDPQCTGRQRADVDTSPVECAKAVSELAWWVTSGQRSLPVLLSVHKGAPSAAFATAEHNSARPQIAIRTAAAGWHICDGVDLDFGWKKSRNNTSQLSVQA
eukprot:6054040-Amphidinium_carterae.2